MKYAIFMYTNKGTQKDCCLKSFEKKSLVKPSKRPDFVNQSKFYDKSLF